MASLPYGDWILDKDEQHTRFRYQNVQGLSAANQFAAAYQAAMVANQHDVDILAMSETNLDWSSNVKGQVCAQIKQVWPTVTLASTSSVETFDTAYQPGGAALLIPHGLSGRVCQRHEDDMGRFTSVVLQGPGGRKLAVICGYRVCPSQITGANEKTAYSQQWRILRRRDATAAADPRQAFLRDITHHIQHYNSDDIPSILLWDANEAINTMRLQKFMRDCEYEESYEHRFPEEVKPATHRMGHVG
jgi:hypothetical protein